MANIVYLGPLSWLTSSSYTCVLNISDSTDYACVEGYYIPVSSLPSGTGSIRAQHGSKYILYIYNTSGTRTATYSASTVASVVSKFITAVGGTTTDPNTENHSIYSVPASGCNLNTGIDYYDYIEVDGSYYHRSQFGSCCAFVVDASGNVTMGPSGSVTATRSTLSTVLTAESCPDAPTVTLTGLSATYSSPVYDGDMYTPSGLTITATYSDNSTSLLDAEDCAITAPSKFVTGNNSITVVYGGCTASVTVVALVRYTYDNLVVNKTVVSYFTGSTVSYDDISVTVTKHDAKTVTSTTETVTTYTHTNIDTSTAGTVVMQVTYQGLTASVNILVHDPVVTAITASKSDTAYYIGEAYSITDISVIADWDDGHQLTVLSGYTVDTSDVDINTAGTYTLVVSYGGQSTTLTITYHVDSVTDVSLSPNSLSCVAGDSPAYSTIVITITHESGLVEQKSVTSSGVTLSALDVNEMVQGSYTAYVRYSTWSLPVSVTVLAPVVRSIVATKLKTQYYIGEALSTNDFTVIATLSDLSQQDVTAYCTFDTDEVDIWHAGTYTIYVTHVSSAETTQIVTYVVQEDNLPALVDGIRVPDRAFMLSSAHIGLRKSETSTVYYGQGCSGIYENGAFTAMTAATGHVRFQTATLTPSCSNIHGLTLESTGRSGVHATYNGNTYLIVYDWDWDGTEWHCTRHIASIVVLFNSSNTGITWGLSLVEPNEISITKRVNYGYNMLCAEPYMYGDENTPGVHTIADSYSGMELQGILPLKGDTGHNVCSTARLGDTIRFLLCYQYGALWANASTEFKTQWEIMSLDDSEGTTQVIQSALNATAWRPSDQRELSVTTTQTTYKSFTLTARVYAAADIADLTTDLEVATQAAPYMSISVSFYYLSADKKASTQNLDMLTYDLTTATGMTVWKQRLVLWGVSGAKSTLWVSEINDPSYFPYPNNCEVFNSDVIKCIPFKGSLLVFTQDGAYQITLSDDGLSYNTTCVQDRLNLKEEDVDSIIPIGNMVAFKNNNLYYMMVPASYDSASYGSLVLAPISKGISDMFNKFSDTVAELLKQMDVTYSSWFLSDWYTYLEQAQYRVVYKIHVFNSAREYYYDLVWVYDTQARVWTMHAYQATKYRIVQFIQSATCASIMCVPKLNTSTVVLRMLQYDTSGCSAADRIISNTDVAVTHVVDTGYRSLGEYCALKKKWREVRYRITNPTGAQLSYGTEFEIDNDIRKHYVGYTYEQDELGTVLYVFPEEADPEDTLLTSTQSANTRSASEWKYNPANIDVPTSCLIRFNVNGKGRLARVRIRDTNSTPFAIHNISYVFRGMSAR